MQNHTKLTFEKGQSPRVTGGDMIKVLLPWTGQDICFHYCEIVQGRITVILRHVFGNSVPRLSRLCLAHYLLVH